jgi:hypothetical protein
MGSSFLWALGILAVTAMALVALVVMFEALDLIGRLLSPLKDWRIFPPALLIAFGLALATAGGPAGGFGLLVAGGGITFLIKANSSQKREMRRRSREPMHIIPKDASKW